jgi:hypothetical protein
MPQPKKVPPRKGKARTVPPRTHKRSQKPIHDDLDEENVELADPPPVTPRRRRAAYESRPAAPGGVFLPDHTQLVRLIAARGMTDKDIEMIYGLGSGTIALWRKHYPGLDRAIEEGRTAADAEVLSALYKTATGYHYEEDQAVGGQNPEIMRVQKWKAGEFAAQKHWLGNRIRRPDSTPEWPRSDQIEMGGIRGGVGITVESRNDLITSILSLITPKDDNERKRRNSEESGAK